MTFHTFDQHQPGQQHRVTQLFSSIRAHTSKDTSTLPRGCSAIPLILDIFEGISTHACCETTLVLAAPQTEPLHNRYLVSQPQYQHPQTPCSCLWLKTKGISPLCRKKWAEKQRPVLVYYSQLNNLPHSKRKTLCRHHSPMFILPNVSQICWHTSRKCDSTSVFSRYFVQTGEQRGEGHTPLPQGSTGQFRDCIADAE